MEPTSGTKIPHLMNTDVILGDHKVRGFHVHECWGWGSFQIRKGGRIIRGGYSNPHFTTCSVVCTKNKEFIRFSRNCTYFMFWKIKSDTPPFSPQTSSKKDKWYDVNRVFGYLFLSTERFACYFFCSYLIAEHKNENESPDVISYKYYLNQH